MATASVAATASTDDFDFSLTTEKKTHLHFYMHDIVTGPNPVAIRVVVPNVTTSSPFKFGTITAIDDPLTVGSNQTSKLVGRAQGLYTLASQTGLNLLWTVNLVFVEGKYKGSTLAVLATDDAFAKVRELPIVGGTGRFRLARGYAILKTVIANFTSGDAILELDVYVVHY